MTETAGPSDGPLYLAIDQGGHASRALVVDAGGAILRRAMHPLEPRRADGDRVEYEAAALLASLRGAIDEALAGLDERRARVIAAGLATQRSNVVCWDRVSGEVLSPVISWQDRRDAAWLDHLSAARGLVRRITGLPLSAHYGANKLRWCLNNLPAVRRALRDDRLAWGPMAAFLVFHLTRERPLLVDRVNAARTQLWDVAANDWSAELHDLFGLPDGPLPAAVPCVHDFGTLAVDGPPVPLRIVTGDQSAALHAAGEPPADRLHATLGTGAFVLRRIERAPRLPGPLLHGLGFDDGQRPLRVLEGTVNGAGSALEWFVQQHPGTDLAALPQWLASVTDPPLFLNGVSGLGTPWMTAAAPVRFIGDGDPAARAVAVIESIVFLLRVNIDAIRAPARALRLGGGLSALDGLCRRLADLTGLRIERSGETETTALGLAWLLREYDPAASPKGGTGWAPAARAADVFEAGDDPALHARYRRWLAALERALPDPALRRSPVAPPCPPVVAHRGDAGRCPENTLPALESAARAGLRAIEVDVQLTADGVPVLFHDDSLKRTTGADGRITTTPLAVLATLSAGEPARFGERFRDARAPTLASVIDWLGGWPELQLFVELKPESLAAFGIETAVRTVLETIEARRRQCVLISFDADALRATQRLGGGETGWVLTRCDTAELRAARRLAPEYLFCNKRKLPRGRVPNGPWRWVVYEVSGRALARRLAARGVDMVESMQVERFSDGG